MDYLTATNLLAEQQWDLPRAQLQGADLRGAALDKLKIPGADLRGADLSGADLRGADLTGADLTGARLYRTDLTGADLTGAKVDSLGTFTYLTGAPERRTILALAQGGIIEVLPGAAFIGVNVLAGSELRAGAFWGAESFWSTRPDGITFTRADLTGVRWQEADLRRASFRSASLTGADLAGADLAGADFYGADLEDADLCGADLTDADFSYANLRDADLRGADLTRTKISPDQVLSAQVNEHTLIPGYLHQEIVRVVEAERW